MNCVVGYTRLFSHFILVQWVVVVVEVDVRYGENGQGDVAVGAGLSLGQDKQIWLQHT